MRYIPLRYFPALLLAMLPAGCAEEGGARPDTAQGPAADARSGRTGEETAASGSSESTASAEVPEEELEEELDLRPVDYAGLQQFIESHAGSPLVLDVWSTSCEPCVKELPNLARLDEDYRDRGVVCATLNIDYTGAAGTTPDDAKAVARPVLEALGVSAKNLYSTMPDRELFKQELFQENGLYAPPAIFVFDTSGNVVSTHSESSPDESVYQAVREQVESLLEDD